MMLSSGSDLLTAVTDGTVSTGSKQNSTVSYDEMGNPTRYLGATMTWAGKQLKYWCKSGKYVNFAYNEDGIRTLKNSNGVVTNYYYNGSLLIGMTVGSGSSTRILRFSYDSSGSVVAVDYSTDNGSTFNTYYYLRNAQNDIVKLIDNSGSTVVEYCYDSWGKLLSTSGSLASTLGKNNPFRYRGYVYDEETGFYYLQSRYYNPEVGRFISSDVLLSTGQGVLGHNAYAYCLNNPVNMDDHDGNWPKWIEDTANWVKDNIVQPIKKVFCALKQSNVPKASSHDANRRPNTGEPGSTYTAPNGDSRTYGADGKPEHDYDHNDHGRPDKHPHDSKGGHHHDWKNGVRGSAYTFSWGTVAGAALVTVSVIGIIVVAADDVTGIGVADDFLLGPLGAGIGEGLALILG